MRLYIHLEEEDSALATIKEYPGSSLQSFGLGNLPTAKQATLFRPFVFTFE